MKKTLCQIETLKILEKYSKKDDKVLISFSGGKDSLVILHLAMKYFKNIVPFHMYFVPHLDIYKKTLSILDTYNLKCLHYPHWSFLNALKEGVYCPNYTNFDELPNVTVIDLYKNIRKDTNINYLFVGAKKTDSMWRRRNSKLVLNANPWLIYPIFEWNKFDVLGYLKANNIPYPIEHSYYGNSSGFDLKRESIIWLYDHYREDFKKVKKWFPFIGSVIKHHQRFS